MNKGVEIELSPIDAEHVRAKISWREQEAGGGTLQIELTVRKGEINRNPMSDSKPTRERWRSDSPGHSPTQSKAELTAGVDFIAENG
jgi:hypothetical protein